MKSRRLEVALRIVVVVILAECATLATGTTCEEIPLEVCSALPYSQTGFPNSLGHASRDQIPPHLGSAFQTLIRIGCYDNSQLFLCAAAFPQCTADGRLLPPCRSLCEGAVSNCGFWFGFYPDLLDGIDCEAMPNSSDSSVCVGLNTPYPQATSEQNEDATLVFDATSQMKSTNSSSMPNSVSTSETLFFTPSPRQPTTTTSNPNKENKTEEDEGRKPANSTLFNYYFTSEVVGQRSTESKGGHKMTDSIDKAVRTDRNSQGGSKNSSAVPTLGIVLSVLSCAGIVVLLISCAFFRKAFGKPFGSRRRKPREGAFYTNPAFSDLPQGPTVTNTNGESLGAKQQPYTLEDLPPHPASVDARPRPLQHATPNVYQQEPGGFVEQNLFTVAHSPRPDHAIEVGHLKTSVSLNAEIENPSSAEKRHRITSDLVYSNTATSVAMDTNANEQGGNASRKDGSNGTATAPPSVESFPMVSSNMDDGDMIIANPIAC
ncbi:uncharacterized protein LOC119732499 [Patiria miniata]|uniref:FZ domain-containing protein n=1 Tax=Patiria miniata TaxID=46514 RepID=A0A914ADR7_PATMI|nr:uncharacterized protein LOC119732499 [Patiria miniata]